MAQQRRGLGKGLGALIPEAPRTGTATLGGRDDRLAGPGGHHPLRTSLPTLQPRPTRHADTGLRQVAGAYFEEVAVGSITPNPRQPRRTFDEEALEELAASITEVGLLQPVVVRKLGDGKLRARHGRAPLARVPAGRP